MSDVSAGALLVSVTKAYDVLLWLMVRQAHHERILMSACESEG